MRGEAKGTHAAGWLITPSCKDAPSVEAAQPYRRRNPQVFKKTCLRTPLVPSLPLLSLPVSVTVTLTLSLAAPF